MAEKKISGMTAAAAAFDTHQLEVNEAGATKRITVAQIFTLLQTQMGLNFSNSVNFAQGWSVAGGVATVDDLGTGVLAGGVISFGSDGMVISAGLTQITLDGTDASVTASRFDAGNNNDDGALNLFSTDIGQEAQVKAFAQTNVGGRIELGSGGGPIGIFEIEANFGSAQIILQDGAFNENVKLEGQTGNVTAQGDLVANKISGIVMQDENGDLKRLVFAGGVVSYTNYP